jgi:hypothetical protein
MKGEPMVVFGTQEVPPGAEEIQPGFFMEKKLIGFNNDRWQFTMWTADGARVVVALVNEPLKGGNYRSRDQGPDVAMVIPRIGVSGIPEGHARAVGKIIIAAADFAAGLNEQHKDAIAKQQEEFEQYERERRLARQRDEEQFKKLYEQVIWLVGSKFRLRRRGMKATVFGTINYVTPPQADGSPPPGAFMRTTSEKGVDMTIRLRDVILMDIKHDDSSRRYDNIYTEQLKEG